MWILLEYAAWAASACLLLWMLVDAARVNREYDEDTLLSSREGIDELLEHGDVPEAREG
ncbi:MULTISPECIES: hypothetical protein [Roseovarius]|jgi:hypothetical protein|uniref:Uncharacterized protein n=1 Tax=Roseovarius nubinhibens (strain ATCC BAA-591 / DSM 15170 / ISM) TaxID=89187 RepID=A3SHI4_ROSNI|nr:hypothetical protein [Roseovarius nubinhibens]EAP76815.1 hypothetical protein ISM_00960 [Roseovarius nubinhibens ISM]MBU3000968.1 hypothetical protein [Roseovarius nubinhibens]|tara:strand:+ start:784 stop:960 length:177 start_codon:yes stop_codon:yes gene_type:complete|eukprot:m.19767 g.19767  ORF g.19767 m.19767 type:complete len:59 (+) comp3724_c0_seq1:771-947(+)